ncbi:DNA-binding domain-containing protein [Spirochaeta cellobiosiphila]|uniref:HU family DNA-binding protein n=1 Tax=Spirochaeta cellobiosiphila TaxID=504483 RepID=UPI000404B372|nr:DNA-binding domain-containing protein [Spirochaeta cellobiosiphila]
MRKINYYLEPNNLQNKELKKYVARVIAKDSLSQEDILNIMASKNTTVSRQDIMVVLDLLTEVIKAELLVGNRINMDLFKASTSIGGGFPEENSEFDPDEHKVRVNLNPSKELKSYILKGASFQKCHPNQKYPKINLIYNFEANNYGPDYSPGQVIELQGRSFDLSDDVQLVLTNETDGSYWDITKVLRRTPTIILCTLPQDLPLGNYHLSLTFGKDLDRIQTCFSNILSIKL